MSAVSHLCSVSEKGPSFTSVTSLWSCVRAFNTRFHAHKLSLAHTDPSLVGTGFPAHVEESFRLLLKMNYFSEKVWLARTLCQRVATQQREVYGVCPCSGRVQRTDLPGSYKDLVLGQLNNLSVPRFFSSVKWGCELQCLLRVAVSLWELRTKPGTWRGVRTSLFSSGAIFCWWIC